MMEVSPAAHAARVVLVATRPMKRPARCTCRRGCPQNRRRTRKHNFVYEAGTASCLEWSLFRVEKREQLTLHTHKTRCGILLSHTRKVKFKVRMRDITLTSCY